MPKLRTQRLALRPIVEDDVPALHRFWTNPDVRRYLWDDRIISVQQVRDIVAASQAFFEEVGSGFFAIALPARPERLIGFCGHRRFEDGESVELLYGILPEHWGAGLVTEAAIEVLRHGFESCGFDRVVAATDTPNQRSVRVMQRLGMVFDHRGQWHGLDTVFYSIEKADFPA